MVYCLYDEYHAYEGSESLPCLVAYIRCAAMLVEQWDREWIRDDALQINPTHHPFL